MTIDSITSPVPADATATDTTVTDTKPTKAAPAAATSSTTVSSLGDLKNKAPEMYDAFCKTIAQTMLHEMQHDQDELKRRMQEARRDAEEG